MLRGADVRGKNRTAFLAEQSITVGGDVLVGAAQSFVLRSGGTIVLKPGSAVSKGGQLL